jgi:hypothetical protein
MSARLTAYAWPLACLAAALTVQAYYAALPFVDRLVAAVLTSAGKVRAW